MTAGEVSPEILSSLEPLAGLSPESARELAGLCVRQRVARGADPFRVQGVQGQSVYLVKGELKITYPDDSFEVIVGGTDGARHALGKRPAGFKSAQAITDAELLLVDDDVLDILLTWDQVMAAHRASAQELPARAGGAAAEQTDWHRMSGMYTARNLTQGAFASLPPAHIDALLGRFERVEVQRGTRVIGEGDEGDYYYLIESGRCTVLRNIGGEAVEIAKLKPGDAFGEEALVADAPRNASVIMKTDGVLLRLAKSDFIELLRQPLLHDVDFAAAEERVARGAVWLDVRFPAEHLQDRLPGALNIPLNEIRNLFGSLDRAREYVVYCQSGRRSSAAAFLLSQRGYRAYWLKGGLHGCAAADGAAGKPR